MRAAGESPKEIMSDGPLRCDSDIMTIQLKELIARREIGVGLDVDDVNRRLRSLFGQYEDSFQEAWGRYLNATPKRLTTSPRSRERSETGP